MRIFMTKIGKNLLARTVLRNNLLLHQGQHIASLEQLFPGARGQRSLLDIKVQLLELSFVETREQFLVSTITPTDMQDGSRVIWTDLTKILKPAANEPAFDIVSMWKLGDGTGHVILFTQCRWTNANTQRNVALSSEVLTSLYQASCGILAAAATKYGQDSSPEAAKALRLFSTCKILFSVMTPKPYAGGVPENCFVISKEQFGQYFGKAFLSRAVFDIVQPIRVNYASPSTLARAAGVGKAVLPVILSERELRHFANWEDFEQRLSKKGIAAAISRHKKALEMQLVFD